MKMGQFLCRSKDTSDVITNVSRRATLSTPETVLSSVDEEQQEEEDQVQQQQQKQHYDRAAPQTVASQGQGQGQGRNKTDNRDWALCELAKKWCKEGDQAYRAGDYDNALMKYKHMLHIPPQMMPNSTKAGQHIAQLAMGSMGRVYASQKNHNDAFLLYERSLDLAVELNNRRAEALTLLKMAKLNRDLGRYRKALKQGDDAVVIFREIDCKRDEALALEDVGNILQKLRKTDLSTLKYKESRRILRAIRNDQNDNGRSRRRNVV